MVPELYLAVLACQSSDSVAVKGQGYDLLVVELRAEGLGLQEEQQEQWERIQ